MRDLAAFCLVLVGLLFSGCSGYGPATVEAAFPTATGPAGELLGRVLPAAGEDELAPSAPPSPEPSIEEEETPTKAVRLGAGVALPIAGQIGSGQGTIPNWSDVWTPGPALEVVYEFPARKKFRPYAQLAQAYFSGQRWTNPSNPGDSWIASDGAVTALLGGAKFELGRSFYAKAGAGILFWPEVSRIDYYTGGDWAILDSGASLALALGGGAEFKLGKLTAYADLEWAIGTGPSETEDAMLFWPRFESSGVGELKLAGGVRLSF